MTQCQVSADVAPPTITSFKYRPAVDADAPGLTCLGDDVTTTFVAETALPTDSGTFRVRAYRSVGSLRASEPIAMISGDVRGKRNVLVRVHDQCFTSEVFGSLKSTGAWSFTCRKRDGALDSRIRSWLTPCKSGDLIQSTRTACSGLRMTTARTSQCRLF
uniref:GTP cyclohydrolase II domain-containing protein n=1 Tax=Hyaloperonospora arabidopsidis (strain Emoy2) TaxID=559515 RepID=M4BYA6_HYAAE